jgi:hypothetical protein
VSTTGSPPIPDDPSPDSRPPEPGPERGLEQPHVPAPRGKIDIERPDVINHVQEAGEESFPASDPPAWPIHRPGAPPPIRRPKDGEAT